MTYYVKRVFGGFAVFDGENNQVGDTQSGSGAAKKADEIADKLNSDVGSKKDQATEFHRGQSRGGRA